jgi:hypothetical protein
VGPRAGLDAVVKRKIPSPRRESIKEQAVWPVTVQKLGRTSCTGDRPIARYLPTQHNTTQHNTNACACMMLRAGFEPIIPVFELPKKERSLFFLIFIVN